jgi:MATE family multidrug resistance protein
MLVRTSALIGTMTLATAIATRIGTTDVAAHQVVNQLWLFLALVVDALAVAAQALVSRYIGEAAPDQARSASHRLLQWGVGVGLVLAAAVWVTGSVLPPLFTDDPAVLDAIGRLWPFLAILQPINGLVFVWDGIYMGAEAFRYLAKAMVASALAAAGVLLCVHPFDLGLHGVWWGVTILMVTRIATLAYPWMTGSVFDND